MLENKKIVIIVIILIIALYFGKSFLFSTVSVEDSKIAQDSKNYVKTFCTEHRGYFDESKLTCSFNGNKCDLNMIIDGYCK